MRKAWGAVALLGILAAAGGGYAAARDTGVEGKVSRALLAGFEHDFLTRMAAAWKVETHLFVDPPRAFYVDRFGVVMTSVVTLEPGFGLALFRGAPTKAEVADYRGRVLQRLPVLRQQMKDSLLECAPRFRALNANDRMAVAVSVYHFEPEDTEGIPSEIVIQATHQALLEARQRPAGTSRDDVFEIEELN